MRIQIWALALVVVAANGVAMANDSFVETFNGDGPYDVGGIWYGFDNPGWEISGNGEMRDGGYAFSILTQADSQDYETVQRKVVDKCSFIERVELRGYLQTPIPPIHPPLTASEFTFYRLDARSTRNRIVIKLDETDNDEREWLLGGRVGASSYGQETRAGSSIAFEIRYDNEPSRATVMFDHDIEDDMPGVTFGPFDTPEKSGDVTKLLAVVGGPAKIEGILDHWTYLSLCESYADFNQSGAMDAQDIDLLSREVRAVTHNSTFDLNGDTLVNGEDRVIWVRDFKATYFGDANLDGQFNSRDLVDVFAAGQYEDAIEGNSGWASGDWNADAEFSSSDLVVAFQDGGYEKGPKLATSGVVPEPSTLVLFALGFLGMRRWARQRP